MAKKVLDAPDKDSAVSTRALAWLRRNALLLVAIAVGTISIALFIGLDLNIGREALLAGLALSWGLTAGFPVSGYVTDKLGDEPGVFLLDLKAEDGDHDSALYWSPYSEFQEFTVVDGGLDNPAPFLYIGRNVDLEEMTVEGVWRGSLTDRELLATISAVKECRGMLEDDARRAFALETNVWSIVYRAAKDATKAVVKTFEEGTLPDEGEGVDNAVTDAMEQFDLERMADRLDDNENPDLDELVEDDGSDDRGGDQEAAPTDESPEQPVPTND